MHPSLDPKIDDPIERYILNTFSQGTALGPTQTAQHTHTNISDHMLSYINRRHATPKTLDNIQTLLINCSNSFWLKVGVMGPVVPPMELF